tara:strand:- start:18223 stop:18561 length:339 start_codon:yes stop_codon:yes gene_type:complete
MKLKGKTRLKKFKSGSFNKSRNNDSTFSNTPKVQKDNTTIDQTVNKYVKKKDKSSLDIKLKKVAKAKTKLTKHTIKRVWDEDIPNLGRTGTGNQAPNPPAGEEGPGGGGGGG